MVEEPLELESELELSVLEGVEAGAGVLGGAAGVLAAGVEVVEVEPPAATPALTVTTRDAEPVFPDESLAV